MKKLFAKYLCILLCFSITILFAACASKERDGSYTASVSGGNAKVTYSTRIWNGYEWVDDGLTYVEVPSDS